MLDIKLIREQPSEVKRRLATVGVSPTDIDGLLQVDRVRRETIGELESLRASRTQRSKEIRSISNPQERDEAIVQMRQVGEQISGLEKDLVVHEEEYNRRLLNMPNLPDPEVPIGKNEKENIVVRTVGELPQFSFTPRPHWD